MAFPVGSPEHSSWLRPTTLLARGQLALLVVLIVLTLGAWALTIHQARTMDMAMGIIARSATEPDQSALESGAMDGADGADAAGMSDAAASGMSGMQQAGWTWDGFATFLIAWAAMMAAMMFPAAAPMLLLFGKVANQRKARGEAIVPTWVFAMGYLMVWTGIGAGTWVFVRLGSDLASRLGSADRATWGPLALGTTLVIAGLYQLTPLKRVCLDHCRSPIHFVMTHWREGYRGALRMGLVHGGYCLGCCWALFAVLVAAGVMSLAWMLLLTVVVFAEKVLPLGLKAAKMTGVAFLLLGMLIVAGAAEFPWSA